MVNSGYQPDASRMPLNPKPPQGGSGVLYPKIDPIEFNVRYEHMSKDFTYGLKHIKLDEIGCFISHDVENDKYKFEMKWVGDPTENGKDGTYGVALDLSENDCINLPYLMGHCVNDLDKLVGSLKWQKEQLDAKDKD